MPRKGEVRKREILPDPKYGDKVVAKFVNTIESSGRVSPIIFTFIGHRDGENERGFWRFARHREHPPHREVRSRRVGGATYQVPVEVRPQRRLSLSMRWLIDAARDRAEKSMEEKLAAEIIDAANNRGTAIKKKEDTHKMAEANKAFAHYRW
jgi:small subunit ribosomal protein S7